MAVLTLELPPQKTQTTFDLRRWAELLADRELATIEGRIETDRHGHMIEEKTKLYFDAGTKEVWLCDQAGAMSFLAAPRSRPIRSSRLCPQFPKRVELH
jgi:hypothetical protein